MEISIIIFCYNEEKNIGQVIRHAIDFLQQPRYKNSELIIINDGSTDQSGTISDSYANSFPNIIIRHLPVNQGIGNALNTGYDLAQKDYVCAVPGDGQFNIFELNEVKEFDDKQFVTFYRKEKNYNLYRAALTHFNQFFNKWFLGIDVPDVNWIKIYRKQQINREYRKLNSSLVESEICGKLIKSGCTHIDYLSVYHDRKYGEAKGGNWRTLKKAISELFQLYLIIRRFPEK